MKFLLPSSFLLITAELIHVFITSTHFISMYCCFSTACQWKLPLKLIKDFSWTTETWMTFLFYQTAGRRNCQETRCERWHSASVQMLDSCLEECHYVKGNIRHICCWDLLSWRRGIEQILHALSKCGLKNSLGKTFSSENLDLKKISVIRTILSHLEGHLFVQNCFVSYTKWRTCWKMASYFKSQDSSCFTCILLRNCPPETTSRCIQPRKTNFASLMCSIEKRMNVHIPVSLVYRLKVFIIHLHKIQLSKIWWRSLWRSQLNPQILK